MPGLWEWSEQPRTACLWKQLLNGGTRLNPGLTAKLDVNYCVDILFSLTVTVGPAACSTAACSVPLLQHCLRCRAKVGVINPDHLFSHTVGHIVE